MVILFGLVFFYVHSMCIKEKNESMPICAFLDCKQEFGVFTMLWMIISVALLYRWLQNDNSLHSNTKPNGLEQRHEWSCREIWGTSRKGLQEWQGQEPDATFQ